MNENEHVSFKMFHLGLKRTLVNAVCEDNVNKYIICILDGVFKHGATLLVSLDVSGRLMGAKSREILFPAQ